MSAGQKREESGVSDLVHERQVPCRIHAELELGVGDDDAALARVLGREVVERERGVAHLRGEACAEQALHASKAMFSSCCAGGGLGGRREERLRQARRQLQARRQRDPAHAARSPGSPSSPSR